MANPFNISSSLIASIQGVNQYSTGLTAGYFIDQIMDKIPIHPSNVVLRVVRQFMQVAMNGVALRFLLPYIHGEGYSSAYTDYTGGYMLVFGLIQGQPTFYSNGKQMVTTLTEVLEEKLFGPPVQNKEPEMQDHPDSSDGYA